MKKILFLLIIFIMVLPALGQDVMKVTVNGRDITYIFLNNEPYVPYSEISMFGFKEDIFKTVPYDTVEGKKYYQLKGCCSLMGLISAEKHDGELTIKLNLCELTCTIKSNDINLDKPVKISVYDRDGKCLKELGMYGDRPYKFFLPPGQYLLKSQRYELYAGGENKKYTTTWGYENNYTKSPGLYVGQTYPYPYQYQTYPYPPGTYPCPGSTCPNPNYTNQTYILLNPTETSVKSDGTGYIMQLDESKNPVYYYWERQIDITGEKIDVEINDSSLHYL